MEQELTATEIGKQDQHSRLGEMRDELTSLRSAVREAETQKAALLRKATGADEMREEIGRLNKEREEGEDRDRTIRIQV